MPSRGNTSLRSGGFCKGCRSQRRGADGGLGDAVAAAEEFLAAGDAEDAAKPFPLFWEKAQTIPALMAGWCAIALNDLEQRGGSQWCAGRNCANTRARNGLCAIELAKQAANAGPIGDLRSKVEESPEDHQADLTLRALYAQALPKRQLANY